jgi:molybdate transport system substrate-binding protein
VIRLLAAVHLTVFAAASLTNVFPLINRAATYSFGGSNMLAAQIEQGAPADVFASANTKLPAQLHAKGLCDTPVVFTRNALVIVVPRKNPAHIRTVGDLARRGIKVDVAAAGVPVGDYTTKVLRTLHLLAAVSKNIVSRETDVRGVLTKVALGEADAGFVYATDARTVSAKVRVIQLPARAEPTIKYAACVVTSSHHHAAAQAFLTALLAAPAQRKLRAAGFLAAP